MITITVPSWIAYLVAAWISLEAVNLVASLYLQYQKWMIKKEITKLNNLKQSGGEYKSSFQQRLEQALKEQQDLEK